MRSRTALRAGSPRLGLFLLLAGAFACGYAPTTGKNLLPEKARRIFVRPLENQTSDAELGVIVATALRRELARRGADAGAAAPAHLEGAVLLSTFGPTAVGGTYQARIRVQVRLVVDGKTETEFISEQGEELLAGQDPLESEGRRRLALRHAADAVARDVVERLEAP